MCIYNKQTSVYTCWHEHAPSLIYPNFSSYRHAPIVSVLFFNPSLQVGLKNIKIVSTFKLEIVHVSEKAMVERRLFGFFLIDIEILKTLS